MEKVKQYLFWALLPLFLVSCGEEEVSVSLSPGLREKTLMMTTSKIETKSVTVYLTNQKAFQGQLIAKALNASSQEIGRAVVPELNLEEDGAKNISFKFDGDLDETLVTKYLIDLKDSSEN